MKAEHSRILGPRDCAMSSRKRLRREFVERLPRRSEAQGQNRFWLEFAPDPFAEYPHSLPPALPWRLLLNADGQFWRRA
jgi:hypothetical protein